ncbi:P-loop containing nucleoside triphosphate hydrolase protein [Aspergillus cavernicola]|uniref:P-loop containing nucleoside triphosphate hydrolase protein n=1 Tax=Aspergillus cavernicola TaxID=176166 RepID=A0ABR4J5N8_9EURO
MTSQTTEDEALHQLQQEQSKLLDKIDELRNIGVGGLVELPQLIVCGNQSSGKSSVLEAISRVRFPSKSNVCTRFATEVILRRNPVSRIRISIEPGPSRIIEEERKRLRSFTHEQFSNSNDLPSLIEKAKECMGVSESSGLGFSDDVLKVEISGPDKPELTLVDLPGLYYSTSREQGQAGIGIVRGLTEKYMQNSRSIILAVISAKTDYHLQEVLNIAARFDPGGKRTLGIITQPDILEANSEEEDTYLQFMRNEKVRLQLGWHALRNRSFETRDISDNARDEQEKEFFSQGRWTSLPRESLGVDTLRRRLSSSLLKHIRQSLPGLIADIQQKISDRVQKLSKLGSPRSTLQQQRGFLLHISSSFERITAQALNGMYADNFFGGLGDAKETGDIRRLRAVVRQLNEFFADAMTIRGCRRTIIEGSLSVPFTTASSLGSGNPYMDGWRAEHINRGALEAEISEQARENRGIELPGSANQLLVGSLFRDQSQPWEELAKSHLLKACDSVRYFVFLVLQHLADEHTSSLLLVSIVEPELERMKQALFNKLDELTAYRKRGHPLPVGKSFLTQMQKARSNRLLQSLTSDLLGREYRTKDETPVYSMKTMEQAITNLETSRDEFAAAEIIDQMQAYYDTAILTFVDNVAILGIENCLLYPLQRIFTSQVVNNMGDSQIQDFAAEPSYVTEERKRLSQELEKLQAGLRTLNLFKPMSIDGLSVFGTKSATPTPAKATNAPGLEKAPVQSDNTASFGSVPLSKAPILLSESKSSTTPTPLSTIAKPTSDTGTPAKSASDARTGHTSSSGLSAPAKNTTQSPSPHAVSSAIGISSNSTNVTPSTRVVSSNFASSAKDTSGPTSASSTSLFNAPVKDTSGSGFGTSLSANDTIRSGFGSSTSLFGEPVKDTSGSGFGTSLSAKGTSGSGFGSSGSLPGTPAKDTTSQPFAGYVKSAFGYPGPLSSLTADITAPRARSPFDTTTLPSTEGQNR